MDFQLTEDHLTTRKWAHEFAEKEIRPVAPEYDESEDFPWPVVTKAAEIGLYSTEFWTEMVAGDSSGLILPMVMEETCWGCAGISLGIFGTGLPLAALAYSATGGSEDRGVRGDRVRGGVGRVGPPDHGQA
jgi:acyl-CoA dehydrogenase